MDTVSTQLDFWWGILHGLTIAPGIYFLVQYAGIRSRSFLSFGLFSCALFGWLITKDSWSALLLAAALTAEILFVFSFLNQWQISGKNARYIIGLGVMAIFGWLEPHFAVVVFILVQALLTILSIRSLQKGFKPSFYMLAGLGLSFGLIPLMLDKSINGFTLCSAVGMIYAWSIGLSSRINQMKRDHEQEHLRQIRRLNELQEQNDQITANLESTVEKRTHQVVQQKEEIINQGKKMLNLYTQIRENIEVARTIQQSILPKLTLLRRFIPDCHIISRPKDLISGDFYFFEAHQNMIYLACVDCTGHGVAGAFTSLIAHHLLKQAVYSSQTADPAAILSELNITFMHALSQNTRDPIEAAGMDIGLCVIDEKTKQLTFSGAKTKLLRCRNREFTSFKDAKLSIGLQAGAHTASFQNQVIDLEPGDAFYMFSDGVTDQIGSIDQYTKFTAVRLKDQLRACVDLSMRDQMITLESTLRDWMNGVEQIDDMLMMGFRIQ